MNQLALLGGEPTRKRPFHSSVVIDEKEWDYIREVLERQEFSRFMGSATPDIEKILVTPSSEAEDISGQYFSFLGGRMVRKFEAAFAKKFNVLYAITVNSATSGLSAAMGAVGIGPGDEVITTCMSFNATAMSIVSVNAIPVFTDVEDKEFCIDPLKIEAAITPKTKAILVVHLLGNAADMDAIMKIAKNHKLFVIEDSAQAPGTKFNDRYVGTIGDIGVFSFQETKNLMTGEGGMVVTNNPAYAKRVRLIRNHGELIADYSWSEQELVNLVGLNYRMTELTAALGIAQLEKLDENNRIRTENAMFLCEILKDIPGLCVPKIKDGTVPHVFPMLYDSLLTGVERQKILAALRAEGIPVGSGYLHLMYENPIFLKKIAYGKNNCPWSCHMYGIERNYRLGDCPVGEELLKKRFIWFYHINRPNTIDDMRDVAEAFKKVFSNLDLLKDADVDVSIPYKW
jgi:dTDP-4-amino-4,6-dideoxygalactose transaminase